MSRKSFRVLAICTVLAVIAAFWAVQQEWSRWSSGEYGTKLFPDLASSFDGIARVQLRHGKTTITLNRTAAGWTVLESDGYPARGKAIQELLYALSESRRVEPKTQDPKKFAKLQVDDATQPKSEAKRIDVLDKNGRSLASLILGKENMLLQAIGEGGAYVRIPDQNQAWLASGNLLAEAEFKNWLDNPIVDIPRQRIEQVVLNHPNGDRMVVTKSLKAEGSFVLEGIGADEKLISQYYPSDIGRALEKLEAHQVRRTDRVEFLENATLKGEYRTIEGMTIAFELTTADGKDWMRVVGVTVAGTASSALAAERTTIEARTKNWAFMLPEFESIHLKKNRSQAVEKTKPQS